MTRTLLVLCAMLVVLPAIADAHSGTVKGRVTDDAGRPLGGVVITATSTEGGGTVRSTSRANGNYAIVIPELEWPWTLRFSLEGFEDGIVELPSDVTPQTRIDFTIHPERREVERGDLEDPEAAAQRRLRAEEAYNLGVDALEAGDPEQAAAFFSEAMKADESFDRPRKALLVMALEAEDWRRAGAAAEAVLAVAPDDVSAMGSAYVAAVKTLDLDRLQLTARRFATADPAAIDDIAGVSRWFLDNEYYAEAVQLLLVVTDLSPDRIDPHYQLGYAANATGDEAAARASFARFLELAPADHADRATAEALLKHLGG